MRRQRRKTSIAGERGPEPDEERILALWEQACNRARVTRAVWLPPGNPVARPALTGRPQPVVSRHVDFAAWFVGD